MPFTEVDMVLSYDAIEFISNQADGKSSSIIAALVNISMIRPQMLSPKS